MSASTAEDENFPTELQDRLTSFDDALTDIENIFHSAHALPIEEIHEKVGAIDKAKLDLIGAYTMNSLFWMYLSVTGENPKEHEIKQELDRIRGYMSRVKEIEDRAKAPKLDKAATKRFVRSALWQEAQKQAEASSTASENNAMKRKVDDSAEPSTSTSSSVATTSSPLVTTPPNKRKKSKKKHHGKN